MRLGKMAKLTCWWLHVILLGPLRTFKSALVPAHQRGFTPVVGLRRPQLRPAKQPVGLKDHDGVNVLALVTQRRCKKVAEIT
jgi:hypothetical protein